MDLDKLGQIRALLAKAEATEFPAEAETLNAKAQDLMFKYGIDEALAEAKSGQNHKPVKRRIDIEHPYAPQKANLLGNLVDIFGGRVVIFTPRKNHRYVEMFGYEDELDMVTVLYTSLILQGATEMINTPVPPLESPRAFRTSFWNAYSNRVVNRARAAYKQTLAEVDDSVGTALVLVDRKKVVNDMVDALYPKLGKAKPSITSSRAGMRAGYDAGERADIHNRQGLQRKSRALT